MDRLAEKAIGILNDCCEDAPENGCGVIDFNDYRQIMNALEELKAYKDAEEHGQLVRLEVKPGCTVWYVESVYVIEYNVLTATVSENGVLYQAESVKRGTVQHFYESEIGSTWFLTYAEADAKRKRHSGGEM